MSETNKAVLQRANAAVTQGDYEGFLSHCTDDTEWTFVGEQVLEGKAAVRRYMLATYVEPPVFDAARLIADGELVVASGEIRIKDASGTVVRSAYCDVWRLRDGLLAELRAYVVELSRERPDGPP